MAASAKEFQEIPNPLPALHGGGTSRCGAMGIWVMDHGGMAWKPARTQHHLDHLEPASATVGAPLIFLGGLVQAHLH